MITTRSITKLVLVICLVAFVIMPVSLPGLRITKLHAIEIDKEEIKEELKRKFSESFYVYAKGGYQFSSWQIHKREMALLAFETEGLHQGNVEVGTVLANIDLASFSYEGPIIPTDRQKELFETNTSYQHGLEKYTADISMEPFADYFCGDNTRLKRYFIKPLLSLRFKYTREAFFGDAAALRDLYYVPYDIDFNFDTDNLEFVNAGEEISFKTIFDDYEFTFSLGSMKEFKRHAVRVGYFHSEWERPSDYFHLRNINNDYYLFATKYYAEGYIIGFSTIERGKEGLNLDLAARMSGSSKRWIKNACCDYEDDLTDNDIGFISLFAGCWYNYYNNENGQISTTFGLEWERRSWTNGRAEEDENGEQDLDSELRIIDEDDIIKGYIRVSYRF